MADLLIVVSVMLVLVIASILFFAAYWWDSFEMSCSGIEAMFAAGLIIGIRIGYLSWKGRM